MNGDQKHTCSSKYCTFIGAFIGCAISFTNLAGCSLYSDIYTIPREELHDIVVRDAAAFDGSALPDELMDSLADKKLVIVGETHQLNEHYAFMAALVEELYDSGYRQLLLEWPQMADWVVLDYVNGGELLPDWEPPFDLFGSLLTAVREFNRALSPAERVHVRGIDVNLDGYGGAHAFRSLVQALVEALGYLGPVEAFLENDYEQAENHSEVMQELINALNRDRVQLQAAWGEEWYDVLVELAEVELASIAIRSMRSRRYETSVKLRETIMKELTDRRLKGFPHRSILNVGGTHAQKKWMKGTKLEWLGDYLVHESTAVGGAVYVMAVVASNLVLATGTVARNELEHSPEDELFRVMSEAYPEQTVFLPLEAAAFSVEHVKLMFEDSIYRCRVKEHYDALLQYPLAHRIQQP